MHESRTIGSYTGSLALQALLITSNYILSRSNRDGTGPMGPEPDVEALQD